MFTYFKNGLKVVIRSICDSGRDGRPFIEVKAQFDQVTSIRQRNRPFFSLDLQFA